MKQNSARISNTNQKTLATNQTSTNFKEVKISESPKVSSFNKTDPKSARQLKYHKQKSLSISSQSKSQAEDNASVSENKKEDSILNDEEEEKKSQSLQS